MLYSVVLVSAVYQSESAICIRISPYPLPLVSPSHPPHATPLGGRKALSCTPVLCSCFPLDIYFTFGSVYMSMPLSHVVQLTRPPPRVLKSILYACIFIPVLSLGYSEAIFVFRFHLYVLAYGICFSLSNLLHSV